MSEPSDDHGSSSLDQTIHLVHKAQGGQSAALHRLFERYYQRVRFIVQLKMGKRLRDYMETSDILQETMIAALKAFDRFEMRDEGSFLHWLSKIAENQIRQAAEHHHAQKRDRRRERALEGVRNAMESGEIRLDPEDDATAVHDKLARREDLELILDCVRALPDEQKEVFILRSYMFDGNQWDRIAELTGKPSKDAARMLYARARAKIARCVSDARGGSAPSA